MHCTSRHLEGVLVCHCNENEWMGYYMMLMKHANYISNDNETCWSYVNVDESCVNDWMWCA